MSNNDKSNKENKIEQEKKLKDTFFSYYEMLSPNYKEIVNTTLHFMEKKGKEAYKDATFEMISENRKKLNISYTELLKMLAEKSGRDPLGIKNAYDKFLNRKSLGSDLLPDTLEILEIKPNDPRYTIKQSALLSNTSWLFDALSKTNKHAILMLAINLYRLEYIPESFEDIEYYE